jgi:hypothetical protein
MIGNLVYEEHDANYMQTDTYIYIATERVIPLRWHIKRKSMSPETLKWGLFGVAVGYGPFERRGNSSLTYICSANSEVHQ